MAALKAVFFDFGGTLYDNSSFLETSANATNRRLLAEKGHFFSEEGMEAARKSSQRKVNDSYGGDPAKNDPGVFALALLAELGLPATEEWALEHDRKFFAEFRKNCRPMDGVRETLAELKARGLKLAIVSNSSAAGMKQNLEEFPISRFFDLIIDSETAGGEKSSLVPLKLALEKLALKPAEVLMVGDNIVEDVDSARRLGMRTCRIEFGYWKDYRRGEFEDAEYLIGSIPEVLGVVRRIADGG